MHYFSMENTKDTPKTHPPPATFQSDLEKGNWTPLKKVTDKGLSASGNTKCYTSNKQVGTNTA